MARLEEPPTPSYTPSLLTPHNYIPTKVDPYETPRPHTVNRCGCSPQIEGRLLALCGAFITGLNLTGIKYLYADNFPAPQALITRYTPPLIFVILIGICMKMIYHKQDWYYFCRDQTAFKILSIRSLFHWLSNLCMIYSLLFVPVMINISLYYIWTIFAIILSHFCLNERANLIDIILSLIGFGGVIMITDPTFVSFQDLGSEYIEGIILILISALFYSINMVILRKKRASYHWTQSESVAGLWATFIFTPCYIVISHYLFDIPMIELIRFDLTLFEWILFILISIFAFIAIGGITRALQLETIIIVSVILYSEVAFGTIFQFVFLNDTTNFNTFGLWIGIGCVMISTFCIMYRKNKIQNDVKEDNEVNKLNHNILENDKLCLKAKQCEANGNILTPFVGDEKLTLIDSVDINKRECYGAVGGQTLV